jgi:peptidoglycan/xylan/chitin deacetylase (PgdA/CDA1 family)
VNSTTSKRPAFLITIDTEGDNIWSSPKEVTTENARYLPRFQALCEKYGLKPTYLTNYEMAASERFIDFGRDAIGHGAEIGMHLHAWNSPPITTLKAKGMPFLIEFPKSVIIEKVKFMTGLLEDRFGVKMTSHRAGRWAFNETYAQILLDHGYRTDCSVTPHVSWRETKGFEDGNGGTDYRAFPAEAYFIDTSDISRPGRSQLLEVPMTIVADRSRTGSVARAVSRSFPRAVRKAANRAFPAAAWFRPNGRNLASMLELLGRRKNSA